METRKWLWMALAVCSVARGAGDFEFSGNKVDLMIDHKSHASHGKELEGDKKADKGNNGHNEAPALSSEVQTYIDQLATNATNYLQHLLDIGVVKETLKNRLAGQILAEKVPSKTAEREAVTCPPPGFNSVSPFSFKDYINGANNITFPPAD